MDGDIRQEIKESFKNGTTLTKVIYINLALFIIVKLALVFCGWFNMDESWSLYAMLPASLNTFIHTPWSIITYMFLHLDFIHIIFNVLMLYWFGTLFLQHYSQHDLVGVYVLGGLAGGAIYMLAFNLIPKFIGMAEFSHLLGASASVMAIIVATAVIAPEKQIKLFFVSQFRLKWLAIGAVVLSMLQMNAENAGGEIAHVGGAIAGFLFAKQYQKGKNITEWINKIIHKTVNLFKGVGIKPKMKVTYDKRESDQDYNYRKKQENDEIDAILDKIKSSGYESLNDDEKRKLFGRNR